MDFWQVLLLLIIVIPLTLIWAVAIWDIFTRRGMSPWSRVIWLVVVLIFPVLGSIIYVGMRSDASDTPIDTGLGTRETEQLGSRPPR
jgi:hypothetical protein